MILLVEQGEELDAMDAVATMALLCALHADVGNGRLFSTLQFLAEEGPNIED